MKRTYLIGLGVLIFLLAVYLLIPRNSNEKKAMVIVEPRKHTDFERVLKQFDAQMPVDWDLYIFHGVSAKGFLQDIIKQLPSGRNIYLKSLDTDNLTATEYNRLFKDPNFWNKVDAEDILVFQTDCALCSRTPHLIDRFRKYGYLGCSYKSDSIGMTEPVWAKELPFYGIGGLSFRKKSFMMKCIKAHPDVHPDRAEDVFYSECIHQEPDGSSLKPESASVLCDFCSQHNYNSDSFGAHKTKLMNKEDKEPFYSYCPEARFLEEQS